MARLGQCLRRIIRADFSQGGIRPCARARARARLPTLWPVCVSSVSLLSCRAVSSRASAIPFYGHLPQRTHTCNELSNATATHKVVLTGWYQSARIVSKQHLGFFTLFDHTGSVQLRVTSSQLLDTLDAIPFQSSLLVRGVVEHRPSSDVNATQQLGQIEVHVSELTLLNPATKQLPFQPSDSLHADRTPDTLRAKYRYLDLRRPSLANNIRLRSHITHAVRNHLYDHGFLEIETPVLLRSTPEGAREFLVPTRSSTGTPAFYALPQSPQQPKQLLIASGVTDKYFQIAKCFRDEDGRKDRQPEFTQIDIEMAFVSGGPSALPTNTQGDARDAQGQWRIGGEQVRYAVEGLLRTIWKVAGRKSLPHHIPVMSYWSAMTMYGSDKPDLRYDLRLHDISDAFVSSSPVDPLDMERRESLEILPHAHSDSGRLSNKQLDALLLPFAGKVERFRINSVESVNELAALLLKKSALVRTFLKHLDTELEASQVDVDRLGERLRQTLAACTNAHGGAMDVFVSLRADPPTGGSTPLGDLRKALAALLVEHRLLDLSVTHDAAVWITEFPLFTLADEDKNVLSALSSGSSTARWQSSHHPFTAPIADDIPLLAHPESLSDDVIAKIRGQHYDFVLNGQELGGGSVRIHSHDLQHAVLRHLLRLNESECARFGHLLHALDCGAPPHGGIALGFDRLMAILCHTQSIRDVIAFPKQSSGVDPLFNSPASLDDDNGTATSQASLLHMYSLQPK